MRQKRLGLEPDQFDVINNRTVITGSFKWSPATAHQNDELLLPDSTLLAAHFTREMGAASRQWGAKGASAEPERGDERQLALESDPNPEQNGSSYATIAYKRGVARLRSIPIGGNAEAFSSQH